MSDIFSTCDFTETFLHLRLQQGFKTLFIDFCQLFKLLSLNWINLNDPTSGAALKYSDSTWLVMEGTGMVPPGPWNQQCSVSWCSVHWLTGWLTDWQAQVFISSDRISISQVTDDDIVMMWDVILLGPADSSLFKQSRRVIRSSDCTTKVFFHGWYFKDNYFRIKSIFWNDDK